MAQIKRFEPVQTGKVFAILYGVVSAIFCIPMGVFTLLFKGASENTAAGTIGAVFILAAPLLYAALGFVIVALSAIVYNFVASKVGGIEMDISS